MVNYQQASDVQIVYSAYSLNANDLDGAAVQLTGSWVRTNLDTLQSFIPSFLTEDNWANDINSPIVDPSLFVVDPIHHGGLAVAITQVEFDLDINNLLISAVTFDSNLDVLLSPTIDGDIDGLGGRSIIGDQSLFRQVSWKINAYADPALGSSKWFYEVGTTEQEGRAYPFFKGQQADLIRQVIAATGVYFRYALTNVDETHQVPYVTMARTPNKITIGGWQKFKARLGQPVASKTVSIVNYNTRLKAQGLYFRATEIYQVGNKETVEIIITVPATPNPYYLVQPVCVDYLDPSDEYYDTYATSEYVMTGSDGLPIPSDRWADRGGNMVVRPGEQPDEVIISITGSDDPSIAPFTISDGPDFPGLVLSTNDTFTVLDPYTIEIPTGAVDRAYNSPTDDPITVDNPFIVSELQAYDALIPVLISINTPQQTAEISFADVILVDQSSSPVATQRGYGLDELSGSIFYRQNNYWRITSLTYNVDTGLYTGSAEQWNLVGDFDVIYAGMTAGDFDALVSGMTAPVFEAAPLLSQYGEEDS